MTESILDMVWRNACKCLAELGLRIILNQIEQSIRTCLIEITRSHLLLELLLGILLTLRLLKQPLVNARCKLILLALLLRLLILLGLLLLLLLLLSGCFLDVL